MPPLSSVRQQHVGATSTNEMVASARVVEERVADMAVAGAAMPAAKAAKAAVMAMAAARAAVAKEAADTAVAAVVVRVVRAVQRRPQAQ